MPRLLPSLLALALLAGAGAWSPAGAAAPDRLALAGGPLARAGEAVRSLLWIDLYRVTLYLPESRRPAPPLDQPDLAKAFRVEVLYDGDLPDRIPADWADKLLPALEPADRLRLKRSYRGLSAGDELLFSFFPGRGTLMEVDGRPVIATRDDRFMKAIVALFAGPDATSSQVREALLRSASPLLATQRDRAAGHAR
ncbi:Chalcone isomerase-like [Tistlia consotensis]|uniref:Chalcone isomerase-like n=1 Tax=Tistlia consotensis USBA 355 TaxID=560819 RepID=A0A1Y6CQ23_9PROT|nr:chalcone isomerase family protein [Tistlia consotensis]SMF80888.1 Chalcone isomerase-like [Tistlia consotensis USBA 355]SNS22035.1 Chalcone isomerase-like [Tistlia consotensis]